MTVIVRSPNMTYERFEEIRDQIFTDEISSAGIISANYSTKKHIAIFSFINESYIPEILKKTVKHHHPVGIHFHD